MTFHSVDLTRLKQNTKQKQAVEWFGKCTVSMIFHRTSSCPISI